MAPTTIASQSYASRIANFSKNEAAKALLETMERKQTNLCLSVDVTTKKDLLDVVKAVAGVVALVKVREREREAADWTLPRSCPLSIFLLPSSSDAHRHCGRL